MSPGQDHFPRKKRMYKKKIEEKILEVWVKPRASKSEILGYREGYLWVRIAAAPVEGEANRLCGQVLASALGVAPSDVEILSGHQSRRKRFRIRGIDPDFLSNWEIQQGKPG